MKVIGITGTIGAGKGTIVDYLKKKHGFAHYSVRDYLIKIIKERNLPLNRDSMVLIANELRANHSASYLIEKLYEEARKECTDCIIESIRTPGEVESLRNKEDFTLLAVDADHKIRYQRILERESETDRISFETFMDNEAREMHSIDPNKQNISSCVAMSEYKLINNGSFVELFHSVEDVMQQIKPKSYV